ncbi:MAG TPA: hypothetical protein PLZ84_08810, partial [Clostridia bacterium]|nr:hypothetical protein [Clostridia bacterium]
NDVPEWARLLYETQYGKTWDVKGSGLILVSSKSELIVLQKGVDYEGESITVSIMPEHQKKFGKISVNFYNWFEIIAADYETDVIAQYNLPLTETGKEKMSAISSTFVFPAVTKKAEGNKYAYYFAGDFNDYTAKERNYNFLIAEKFNQIFSYDRSGDFNNFYWKMYVPLVRNILNEAYKNKNELKNGKKNEEASFRLAGSRFEIKDGTLWRSFSVRGFNINAVLPGNKSGQYTRDISVYRTFIDKIVEMGGNCVRAYDLVPPEFYRAISEHNAANPENKIYFFQSVKLPSNIAKGEYLSESAQSIIDMKIEQTLDAVHGNAREAEYLNDVSAYLIAYLIEADISEDSIVELNLTNLGYTYSGKYFFCATSPAEAFIARLCDKVASYEQEKYGYISPMGALGNITLAKNSPFIDENAPVFDIQHIEAGKTVKSQF